MSDYIISETIDPYMFTALAVGDYKILSGPQCLDFTQSPDFPNSSYAYSWELERNCSYAASAYDDRAFERARAGAPGALPCLYNLRTDPNEMVDIAANEPAKLAELSQRLLQLMKTLYNPNRGKASDDAYDQLAKNGGYWGPWLP